MQFVSFINNVLVCVGTFEFTKARKGIKNRHVCKVRFPALCLRLLLESVEPKEPSCRADGSTSGLLGQQNVGARGMNY